MLLTSPSVRCSSLPLVSACSAARVDDGLAIEGPRGPADLGTAFHEIMRDVVDGRETDVDAVAAAAQVDRRELWGLVAWASSLWDDRLAAWFPGARTELELAGTLGGRVVLTGHLDVGAVVGAEARVLDWKTGRRDADPGQQLRGYAWLMLQTSPELERATVVKLDVRHRYADVRTYSREELAAWAGWMADHLADDCFRPGPHCGLCPRASACPAHWANVRAGIASFDMLDAAVATGSVASLTAENLASAVETARAVAKLAERFVDAARAVVVAEGGKLGRLRVIEQEERPIDAARAWPVLLDTLGLDTLLSCASVSKTKVLDAVRAAAGRGGKKQAAADLMERLAAAEAVTVNTKLILKVLDHVDTNASAQPIGPDDGGDSRPLETVAGGTVSAGGENGVGYADGAEIQATRKDVDGPNPEN